MRAVQLDRAQGVTAAHAHRLHEVQGLHDAVLHVFVVGPALRLGHEAQIPVAGVVQVGKPAVQ